MRNIIGFQTKLETSLSVFFVKLRWNEEVKNKLMQI